jgi:hypothetical protein
MMETYYMKKSMKPSKKIKTIIVKCLNWSDKVEVDSEIHDDVYMEAATRVIEKNKKTPNFTVSVVMECYDKNDEKDPYKHIVYNTYFVLINAGLHEKAEMLRLNFLKVNKIDLQKQSLKGDESGNPNTPNTANN